MKASVHSIEGAKAREIELPKAFEGEVDEGLIKRAVLSARSAKRQAFGPKRMSGRDNTANYIGARHYPTQMRSINTGRARRPRLKNKRSLLYGRVAGISGVVGGPKAHAPKPEKKTEEKMNRKERKKAVLSAIAATAIKELVEKRGHRFEAGELPVIVEEKFEQVSKTREAAETLKALGVLEDVERAKEKRKKRSGKGKRRGRRKKRAKSILIVVSSKARGIEKAARNLEGVDVAKAKTLSAELLAPGAKPGRLAVFTEAALKEIAE